MAEIAISFIVSTAAERLSKVLIHESTVLSGVLRQVEWIERELRLMQAFLEHVEHRGEEEEEEEWLKELSDVARDAGDVIETFVIKTVKRRSVGLLYWYDRYKVGKELEKISKRMRDVAQRRMNYEQANLAVTVETQGPGGEYPSLSSSSSSPATIFHPAMEKLDCILSQNLVTHDEVIKMVEHAKDELGDMENIVSNIIKTTGGELSEREKVWMEEVKEVCNNTESTAANFIARRENRSKKSTLERFFTPGSEWGYLSQWKFKKEMKYVRTQIADAVYRSVTYGVGGRQDMGDKIELRSRPVPSLPLGRLIIAKLPLISFLCVLPFVSIGYEVYLIFSILALFEALVLNERRNFLLTALNYGLFDLVVFILFVTLSFNAEIVLVLGSLLYSFIVWVVSLWRSTDKNLKLTQRYLALMRAMFSDIERAQDLNERQKVWADQLSEVAQYGQSLIASQRRGRCFSRIKFAKDINALFKKILIISDRKTIYGIASIQAAATKIATRTPLPTSLAPSIQETDEITDDNDGDSNSCKELQLMIQDGVEHPAASSYRPMTYRPMTGMQEKVQTIRGEMQLMHALFKDVQDIGELDGRSTIWVEQMRGIAREAQSVLDEYAAQFEHKPFHVHILNYKARLVMKRKLHRIINTIKDASRRRKAYGLVQLQSQADQSLFAIQVLRRRKQPSLVVKESSIVGMDDDMQVLVDQLLSDDQSRCVTSIVGTEGIGKKTLARLVFNNDAVNIHFDCRIWMSVPPNCVTEQLIQDIAKEAAKQIMRGQRQDTWTTEEVLKTFVSKRYLLVVDGMVNSQVLDSLEKAIPDMSTASRILLISRNVSVEQRAVATRTFVHPLQLLDDQNSWILFTRNLKLEMDIPQELIKLAKAIVIKCGGLPSEILKISQSLSNIDVTYEEWSRVLEQLNQDQKPWLETLNTVNMNLPLYLRRCLFYFLLFPADYGIPARRLIVLWVAEGLVHQGEHEEPPEEIAERYLAELIDLNMVQIAKRKSNGKVKTCRIPNALRELWLVKANESRFLQGSNTNTVNDPDADTKISIIRRVADHLDKNDIWHNHIHNSSASASLSKYYNDVLSFLSFDAQEGNKPGQDIGNFLKRCILSNCFLQLRVLDLERVYRPKLPKSIARLSRLRYLGLRWTYLESFPSSISSLLKLQTLDLKHTYINTLTSSIWKMELRHLFLSETYRTRFPPQPKGISHSLSDLQTLWGLFVDEETPVKGGLDRLVNIRKLGLACQSMSSQQEAMESQLEAVADWIVKLEHLQSLRLITFQTGG